MVSHPNFCLMREGAFRLDGASPPACPAAAGCVALRRRPLGTRLSHPAVVRWARFARCMFQDLLGTGRGTERLRPQIFGAVGLSSLTAVLVWRISLPKQLFF